MIEPDLDGRTALVTGSARGVGRELLMALADCGADVAVHYRTSADEAEDVVERARDLGAAATTVQGDVTDPDDVTAIFEAIAADLAPVELLVNNVGNFDPRHWSELTPDEWNRVLDTNLTATYLCCREALPEMRDREFGRIVNIGYASAENSMINPKNAPYFIAKTGVLMFTRMLAADTRDDGITVNAVSPYVVENSEVFPEELPRGRPASFDDVIAPVLFFLDEASDYLSGENMEVDGGWLPENV